MTNDEYDVEMDLDIPYQFNVDDITLQDYGVSKIILKWLQNNLSNLKDANNNTIFSKVNYGYNENTLKGFGKKPVCDVYLTTINYDSDFDSNKPISINSAIICYLKGNMNNAYLKACELNDYLIQQFNENDNWRQYIINDKTTNPPIYEKYVTATFIRKNELRIIPGQKTYGVLCAFELEHQL